MIRFSKRTHLLIAILTITLFIFGYTHLDYVEQTVMSDSNVSGEARYNFYQVNISILKNGSLSITELWNVSFRAFDGSFRFGYRIIPVSGFDDIDMFRAYELAGHVFLPLKTVVIKGYGKIGLKFYFEPTIYGTRTFVLRYLVKNALYSDSEHNILRWLIFPEEHEYIANAEFNIFVPSEVIEVSAEKSRHITIKPTIIREKSRTLIHGKVGSLSSYQTVKLTCTFNKIVEPPFSLRKILSDLTPILFPFLVVIALYIGLVIIDGIIRYRLPEYVSVERVISDLDPVEFYFLKYRNPPETALGLALIFYYGINGLLKLVVRPNNIYINEIYEGSLGKEWLDKPYLYIKREIRDSGLIIESGICTRIGEKATKYKEQIVESLISKGYLYRRVDYDPELSLAGFLGIITIFVATTLIALNISQVFTTLAFYSVASYVLFVTMVLIGKDKKTPLGRGSLEAIKRTLKHSYRRPEFLIRKVFLILNKEIPYILAFPESTRKLLKLLNKAKDKIIDYGELYSHWTISYVHRQTEEGGLSELIVYLQSTIKGIITTIKKLGILETTHGSTSGFSYTPSYAGGGYRGEFGGGGKAGFG